MSDAAEEDYEATLSGPDLADELDHWSRMEAEISRLRLASFRLVTAEGTSAASEETAALSVPRPGGVERPSEPEPESGRADSGRTVRRYPTTSEEELDVEIEREPPSASISDSSTGSPSD